MAKASNGEMPLVEHLRELRRRVVVSALAVTVAFIPAWGHYAGIFAFLKLPLDGLLSDSVQLQLSNITDPFTLQIQVCLVAAIIATSPVWLFQLWRFVTPGLHKNERKWAYFFLATASPLAFLGAAAAYWTLPVSLKLLIGFTPESVTNLIAVDKYFEFGPNLVAIPMANEGYEEMQIGDPANLDNIKNAHANFLKQAITDLYTHNREADAARWHKYLADKYGMDDASSMSFIDKALRVSGEVGLDPTLILAVTAVESGFNPNAVSRKGAKGLMQLMPGTAQWVAGKLGLRNWRWGSVTDPDTNIQFGTYYLRHVQDFLDGNAVLATAAYNAGPGRARQWRPERTMDAAIWAENIPFNETRHYVKLVMANASYYAHLLTQQVQSLKARIGEVTPAPPKEAKEEKAGEAIP